MLFSMQEALRKRNEKKERKQNLRIKRPTFIAFDSHCNSLGVCIVGGADTVLSSLYIDQVGFYYFSLLCIAIERI